MIIEGLMMVLIIILAIKVWRNEDRLNLINEEVEDWIAYTRELKQRCDGHKELIKALSKSVRELNGVVEASVKDKEQTSDNKPDTKALIGGWTTDNAETTWLDDILAKIRKEEAKPIDASHISAGMIMMWHGRFVNECGRLADGTDPLKALDMEIKSRHIIGIAAKMTKSEWEKEFAAAMELAYKAAMVIAMAVLWGDFGWGGVKRLPKFCSAYLNYLMEIGRQNTSITELVDLLETKAGVHVDLAEKGFTADFRKAKGKDRIA